MDNDKYRDDHTKKEVDPPGNDYSQPESETSDYLTEKRSGDKIPSHESPEFARSFEVDHPTADEWNEGRGADDLAPDKDPGQEPDGPKAPGFLKRLMNRGEPVPTEEELTEEARRKIREHYRTPLFDEEKDRYNAEESTRSVPVELLENEKELKNPAARRVEAADSKAARTEMDELVREGREPLSDKERKTQRMKNRAILILVLAGILIILFFTAPLIQESLFKTQGDSLIFNPVRGVFGPRGGIVEISIGLFGLALLINTLRRSGGGKTVAKDRPAGGRNRNLLRNLSLVLLLFIPLGISSLFNYIEFRNNDIRFSSIFNSNRTYSYDSIAHQDVVSRGEEVFYTLETGDGRSARLSVSELEAETVRFVDAKLPAGRVVRFTSTAVDQLVEQGIYTWEEAIGVFTPQK